MLGQFVGNDIRFWQGKKIKDTLQTSTEDGPLLHKANIEDSHSLIACCACDEAVKGRETISEAFTTLLKQGKSKLKGSKGGKGDGGGRQPKP
jgi:hypothetical protein